MVSETDEIVKEAYRIWMSGDGIDDLDREPAHIRRDFTSAINYVVDNYIGYPEPDKETNEIPSVTQKRGTVYVSPNFMGVKDHEDDVWEIAEITYAMCHRRVRTNVLVRCPEEEVADHMDCFEAYLLRTGKGAANGK